MRIVGDGFLAHNLRREFGDRFDGVTAFAAGVSATSVTDPAMFDREADLLYRTLDRCRAERTILLFFSTASFAMYGSTDSPATETGPVCPPSVYGRHKLALETCVRLSAVDHVTLRLSHLVGPDQRAHQILPAMARQVASGTVTIHEGAYRDLLDMRLLLDAIGVLLRRGVTGHVVNVASGMPQSVEDIVAGIERRLGVTARRRYVAGAVNRTVVSTALLRTLAPELDGRFPGAGYLDEVLDRYLPLYAPVPVPVSAPTGIRTA